MGETTPRLQPLRVSFKVPRSEIGRTEEAVEALPEGAALPAQFERLHLRGEVTLQIDAPFAPDPLLDRLRRSGAVDTGGPVRVTLLQPVGHVIGQLAGAMVLARRGEGAFTIPLSGGRGALTVGYEGEDLLLGVPLAAYAGVAAIPGRPAARAVGEACGALHEVLRALPGLGRWGLVAFLRREQAILEGDGQEPAAERAAPAPVRCALADTAEGSPVGPESMAADAEAGGAHVVPYWRVRRGPGNGVLRFEPLRAPGRGDRAGALALFVLPGEDRLVVASLGADRDGEARLRARLRRRAPFAASFEGGRLLWIVEGSGKLPMA
jgi:hypothetical protein